MGIVDLLTKGAGNTVEGVLKGAKSLAKDIRSAITGQISPEKAELEAKTLWIGAQHASVLTSGWRPSVGWTCGTALALNFVVIPLAVQDAAFFDKKVPLVPLDTRPLLTLLIGILGLAGCRTLEKAQGIQGRH